MIGWWRPACQGTGAIVRVAVRAIDHAHQALRVERLLENREEFRVGPGPQQAALVARNSDHRRVVRPLRRAQLVPARRSRSPSAAPIDHHHIRFERFEQTQARQPIRGGANVITGQSQRRAQRISRALSSSSTSRTWGRREVRLSDTGYTRSPKHIPRQRSSTKSGRQFP